MSERCDFSDLPAEACGCTHCRPDLAAPPIRPRVIQTSMAVFSSRCSGCDESIVVGDPIALTDRDGWICGECGGLDA